MLQWHQSIFCRFDRDRKTLLIFSIMIDINHLNMQLPRYTINQNTVRWTEYHYLISAISASTESALERCFPHWLQSWFQNKKWSPIWSHLWECCWFQVWGWWSLWVLQQKKGTWTCGVRQRNVQGEGPSEEIVGEHENVVHFSTYFALKILVINYIPLPSQVRKSQGSELWIPTYSANKHTWKCSTTNLPYTDL